MVDRNHSEVKIAQSSHINKLECAALVIKQQYAAVADCTLTLERNY